ncbi:MAG: amidohydrolase family protein [Paludibacteraceae bacterium]|nr:amidohydrolase family protein [Paludibacteraceae bacterium]
MKHSWLLLLATALFLPACSDPRPADGERTQDSPVNHILLRDFAPTVINNIPVTRVERARFDIIDMHSHDYTSNPEEIAQWVRVMDSVGVLNTAVMHCSWIGRPFEEFVQAYEPYKDRFRFWCCFDYTGIDTDEWPAAGIAALERCHDLGAVGIGEMGDKGEGDTYARPADGTGIHIDDPRLRPLLAKCAELRMPVSIHIAEPYWMYLPMDETNDGLVNAVTWHVDTADCYGYDQLINSFENAVRDNPATIFIACHYLNMNHDLPRLASLLDKYPNMYFDISARVAESAHTPRATRDFLIRYQDRVLFGTDNGTEPSMYHNIFRVLETNDEHFYVPEYGYHWPLSALNLPDDVLRKLYHDNAERILTQYR